MYKRRVNSKRLKSDVIGTKVNDGQEVEDHECNFMDEGDQKLSRYGKRNKPISLVKVLFSGQNGRSLRGQRTLLCNTMLIHL